MPILSITNIFRHFDKIYATYNIPNRLSNTMAPVANKTLNESMGLNKVALIGSNSLLGLHMKRELSEAGIQTNNFDFDEGSNDFNDEQLLKAITGCQAV